MLQKDTVWQSIFELIHSTEYFDLIGRIDVLITEYNDRWDVQKWRAYDKHFSLYVVNNSEIMEHYAVDGRKAYGLDRKNLLDQMEDYEKEIAKFIRKNHLKLNKSLDCIEVFDQYASIKSPSAARVSENP